MRGRRVCRAITAGVVAGVLGALAACSNPVDVVAALTDDVKVANNLYLGVSSVTPAGAATEVSPAVPITIVFDRDVDDETLTSDTVVISPSTGWLDADLGLSLNYDSTNRTVTISHGTYFRAGETYTVSVTQGVLGADASTLRSGVLWSFTTGLVPLGTVTIEAGSSYLTDSDPVTLSFTYDDFVDKMRFATAAAALESLSWEAASPTRTFSLESGEGQKTVYVQFRDDGTATVSPILGDSILRDLTPPEVEISAPEYMNIAVPAPTLTGIVTDGGSGPGTYAWSQTSGPGVVTFGSQTAAETTASASEDGTYGISLTVADRAGHTASTSVTIACDTVAPTAPTVAVSETPTFDTTPTWTWTAGGGGNGTFRYKIDSGDYTETTELTRTPGALSDALHYLYVQERDDAGNWSASGSRACRVTRVLPYNGQTSVPTSAILQWRSSGANARYYLYRVTEKTAVELTPSGGITDTSWDADPPANTTFTWRYKVYYKETTIWYPSSTGTYSFTTGSR